MAPVLEDLYLRPAARSWRCAPPPDVAGFHRSLPGYAPTPLVEAPALATELGADRVFVKDESVRLGLPAFKILGASWGIHRALRAGPRPERLVTATDGNHGRAVAAVARMLGLPAQIFVPLGVHPEALAAIRAEGAEVVELDGSYDDAVRAAASAPGLLVQDTAWPGYEDVPQWIVEGYSTLFTEIEAQLDGTPDLVAIPVGVGSLAQAAVAHYRSRAGATTLLSVEPESAACVLTSLLRGRPTTVPTGSTIMAGLNCATLSSLAWPFLQNGLDAAIAIPDTAAVQAVRDLTALGIPAGPCGAAALAGVRVAPALARGTIVLLSTEGAVANPAV
ncbi:pyridoxal-phosphate dependent enzyme [Actinomadura sp. 9N407]|uniref:pyridoxal-phosphate dependent enzyme n=1 Tax=Actinomadura sp. 9N407 TaxID=3375154 RepID=UPI0037A620CA